MPEKKAILRMGRYSLAFVGGFDLAAEWMGWENVFHCEWNEFGQKILKYYWPDAISYGDITKTDFTIYRGKIDILTGGFPCQPYSLAGKRKGKEDERHLWPEMLRAIREIQPDWVVGENVPGIINWSGGLVFHEVQTDLETEGYEVFPVVLPACSVGTWHKRDRVWFIAYNSNTRIEGMQKRENKIYESRTSSNSSGERRYHRLQVREKKTHTASGIISDDGITPNANSRRQSSKEYGQKESGLIAEKSSINDWTNFPTQSPLCSGDDGISSRLDGITFPKWRNESIKACGNAIVPQIALQIFKAIEEYEFALSKNES